MSLLDLYVVQYKVLENLDNEKNNVTEFSNNILIKKSLDGLRSDAVNDSKYIICHDSSVEDVDCSLNKFLEDGILIGRYGPKNSFNKVEVFCDKYSGISREHGILKINSIGDLVFSDTSKNGSCVIGSDDKHLYSVSGNESVLFSHDYKDEKGGIASVSFGNKLSFFQGLRFLFSPNTNNYNYTIEISLKPK